MGEKLKPIGTTGKIRGNKKFTAFKGSGCTGGVSVTGGKKMKARRYI